MLSVLFEPGEMKEKLSDDVSVSADCYRVVRASVVEEGWMMIIDQRRSRHR